MSTERVIDEATDVVKNDMMRVFNLYLLRLPHMDIDTNWGDQIVDLTIDLAREVDTILERIKAVAVEQADYHENGRVRVIERRLNDAVNARTE